MQTQRRIGVNPDSTLTRRFRLTCEEDARPAKYVVQHLKGVLGVVDAILDENVLVTLRYDAALNQLDPLLKELASLGWSPADGRWQRIKLGWYRYIDRNTRDNARHVPHCCNKPPKG